LSFQRTGIKRLAATFGSKGWSGKAANKVADWLEKSGFEVLETYEVNYRPTTDELEHCYEIGKIMAEKIKQMGED
jgi:flavorubredoxin